MSVTTSEYPQAPDFPAADQVETDLDGLLEDIADDGADDDGDVDETTPGSSNGPSRAKSGANRALIRRVANKAAELAGAPKSRKETLASMLGCSTELSELTFAVMSSDRSALAAATDLTAIAVEDAFSAAVVAGAQGRPRMRGVWALLTTLHADLPATIPASDPKAAIALAIACSKLSPSTTDELAKVVALARKS